MGPFELATLISAGATVVLAIYAGIQIWLMRKDVQESKLHRSATIAIHVIETMDKLGHERHQLYALPNDHRIWNAKQRELAHHVCSKLQQVAYLAETGLFDEKYLLENYAGVFYKSWKKLENFIRDYRESCGEPRTIEEGAFQRRHLEKFARKCENYLKKFHLLDND